MEDYGSYPMLIDIVTKEDITKIQEVYDMDAEFFLFWAQRYIRKQAVEAERIKKAHAQAKNKR